MKAGTARLNAQDAAFVLSIITDLETHAQDLRKMVEEGYTSTGITNTLTTVGDQFVGWHYRPLAGQKWTRWDSEGNPASTTGREISNAEEYLDQLAAELYEGTYPGFRETEGGKDATV